MVIQKEWKGNKAGCALDLEGGGGLGGAVWLVDYSIVTILTEPRKEKARHPVSLSRRSPAGIAE